MKNDHNTEEKNIKSDKVLQQLLYQLLTDLVFDYSIKVGIKDEKQDINDSKKNYYYCTGVYSNFRWLKIFSVLF